MRTIPKYKGVTSVQPQNWIARVAPFLLPALFFQSAIFAFISPLPLFILTLRNHLWMSALALATNLAVLFSFSAKNELYLAGFFWFGVGVLFPFLIRKTGRIQISLAFSYGYLVMILLVSLFYLAQSAGMTPIEYARAEISMGMDRLIQMTDSPVKKIVQEEGRDGLFRQLMTELPSGILIALLVAFWINLLFASQILKGFLSKSFWSSFRIAEWVVWPTLVCGALFAFTEHAPYYLGLNGFKLLMTLYAFQGLSIISFFLNRAKVNGFIRAVAFCFAVLITLPMVIAIGFFDLWFDFRRKFGQF